MSKTKTLTWDLETKPLDFETIHPYAQNHFWENAKDGRKKVNDEYCLKKYIEYYKERKFGTLPTDKYNKDFETLYDKIGKAMAFDGISAEIVCIGVKIDRDDAYALSYFNHTGEKEIITHFWEIAERQGSTALWITKNGLSFDLPFLLMRTMVHDISIPAWFKPGNYLRKFTTRPHFDVQAVHVNWYGKGMKLEVMAALMGLDLGYTVEGNCEGSRVGEFWYRKEYKEIDKYCIADVEKTFRIAQKMEKYYL